MSSVAAKTSTLNNLGINTPRNCLSEEIGDSSHARRYKAAPWPDEADVSGVAHEFVENGDDFGISKIIGERDLGKPADSHTGQHTGPDRFDTVGRKISAHWHAESTFWPHKRPMCWLRQAAIQKTIVIDELSGGLWYSALLKVPARADAYQRSAAYALGDRVKIVHGSDAYRKINSIFHHISHEVRENEIYLKPGVE